MAKSSDDISVLAGTGGVVLGEARTNHEGRKAVLLIRGDEDTSEFVALVETMGIAIVETLHQPGIEDPRGYFGKGRLQDVADELSSRVQGHPWQNVDLVLMHTNASPRQLVGVSSAVKSKFGIGFVCCCLCSPHMLRHLRLGCRYVLHECLATEPY